MEQVNMIAQDSGLRAQKKSVVPLISVFWYEGWKWCERLEKGFCTDTNFERKNIEMCWTAI